LWLQTCRDPANPLQTWEALAEGKGPDVVHESLYKGNGIIIEIVKSFDAS
jgi:hypothetical protein